MLARTVLFGFDYLLLGILIQNLRFVCYFCFIVLFQLVNQIFIAVYLPKLLSLRQVVGLLLLNLRQLALESVGIQFVAGLLFYLVLFLTLLTFYFFSLIAVLPLSFLVQSVIEPGVRVL